MYQGLALSNLISKSDYELFSLVCQIPLQPALQCSQVHLDPSADQ